MPSLVPPNTISQAPSAPINGVIPMVAEVPLSFPLPYGAVGTVTYSLTLARGAIVPIEALQTNEDKEYVFVILNGKVVIRNITILAQSETSAAVSGVEDGTQVVLNPPPGLLEGAAVQVVTSGVSAQGANPQGSLSPAGPAAMQPPSAGGKAAGGSSSAKP